MPRPITLDSDVFKCCHQVETLGWSDDEEAKHLLQRAADQVKPIMARRRWAVPLLAEFYPPMPNLLGLNHNHGQKIEVRLRSPQNQNAFLPYESILGTLLHELVHIEIGPHNAEFYKLLDELQDECDTLIATGAGPPSKNFGNGNIDGNRLSYSRPPPKHIAKERALAAADRRQKIGRLMSNRGGQTLGGDQQLNEIAALCDPREMALAAAQRRFNDEIWCSTCSGLHENASTTGAGPSSRNIDVIDLDGDTPSAENVDDDVILVEEKKVERVGRPPIKRPVRRRVPESRIPIRENPAALAALERAQRGRGRNSARRR